VTAYLHPCTIIKLIKALEEVLIHDQLIVLNNEAKNLINDEKISGRKDYFISRKNKLYFRT